MAVAGTGAMGKALDNLRTLVAASSTFQSWVGSPGDAGAAAARCYLVAEDSPTRPFGLARFPVPADWRSNAIAGGAAQYYDLGSGVLELFLEWTVAADLNHADAERTFFNTVDAIISEMLALSGSGTYFAIKSVECSHGPVRSSADETHSEGDYYQMGFRIAYGESEVSG